MPLPDGSKPPVPSSMRKALAHPEQGEAWGEANRKEWENMLGETSDAKQVTLRPVTVNPATRTTRLVSVRSLKDRPDSKNYTAKVRVCLDGSRDIKGKDYEEAYMACVKSQKVNALPPRAAERG